MMRIKRNDIKYFLNPGWKPSPKESIPGFLLAMIIIGIPTAISDVHAKVTITIMIPIIIAFSIWTILLLTNVLNQNQFNLFTGTSALFLSLSFFLVAYKYSINCGQQVSFKTVFLFLGLYFIYIGVNLANLIRLIYKGRYRQEKKHTNVWELSPFFAATIVVFGRRLFGMLNQNFLDHLIIVFFVMMAFLTALGMVNIVRYCLDVTVKDWQ